MNGGTIENGRAGSNGANIYVTSTATVTINDGAIKGGLIKGAGKNGGSMFLGSKTTFTLNGGSITGGACYNGGGNIYTNGRFIMNGGYIGGGVCYSSATGKRNPDSLNYNLMVVNGRFDMYGGKIAGGVGITDSNATDKLRATVVLSGYASICDGANGNNLYLSASGEGVKVLVGTLYDSARIGVNTTVGLFTEPTQEKYVNNFFSDIQGADIVYHQERLGLGRLSCVCGKERHTYGCDETVLLWTPWTKNTSLPTATGIYYLLEDVTTTGQTVVTGEKDVKLDLNGKTVTYQVKPSAYDGFRLYRSEQGAVLTITDTTDQPGVLRTVMPGEDAVYPGKTTKQTVKDEDGNVVERIYYTEDEMRAAWAKGNNGMILWARGGTINLFEGIVDGSKLTGASAGLAVLVNNRTITEDGKTDFWQGKLNMYGGTVLGGYTKQSGNVAVYEKAQMNVYGGTVCDGRAYNGGNIYVAGTLDIYGGTVEGGVVDRSGDAVDGGQGGNIAVDATGVMNLHGGTVKDGYVRGGKNGGGQGGNIFVAGKLYADGGVVERGDAVGGGNIATIRADSFIRLQNVKVLDGQADAGGNILIGVRTNQGLELLEGAVISGGHARSSAKGGNGGNIAINLSSNTRDQEQLILIDGAIIKDGTSVGTGGNIRVRNLSADAFDENGKQTHYLANVKIVMRSGSILGGTNDTGRNDSTVQNGGSVFLSDASEFILEGGTVEGGDCSDGGGNFYVNGRLEIRGGTVKNGTRVGNGHAAANIFVVGGELALSGGTVDGNVAVAGTSTLTLSGKPVVNKGSHGGITLRNENIYVIDGLLESGASVYTNGRGYISQPVQAGNEAYLHSVDGYGSYHHDGRIFLGKVSCLCGQATHTPGCVDAMAALGMEPSDGLALMPVTDISDLENGGFWYLPKTLTGGKNIYVKDDLPLVLDLNGQTLNANHGGFLFTTQAATQGAVLVITDTLGGGAVKLTGTKSTTAQGGILRASGKSSNDQVFVLGGTLDASGYPLTSTGLGGTVAYVAYGNTLYQYGGTLVGRDSGDQVAAGNTVHVKQGSFVLADGTVKGGSAKRGGNIYVETTGAMVMSGGCVEGGQATENGNNLYIRGEFVMDGGTASGVYADSDKVTLTGEASVDGLQVAPKRLVDVKGLTGTLTVTGEAGRAFAHGEKDQTNIESLLADHPVTFYEEDFLYLGKAVDIYCVCGATVSGKACQCDGKLHRWTDWEETDSLPAESGYWRLTDTVNVATVNTLSSAKEIYLDLNGQTVNLQNGENLYTFQDNKNARVVLTDSSATGAGRAVLTGSDGANGGFSDIKVGNTVELYRATLDASGFTTDENGAVFAVRGSFVMHSGKLIGGKAPKNLKNGGTLWMAKGSKVTVESGEILGGEAGRWGGAIYVTGEGTKLTLENGTVTGGTAKENGGAIIVRDKALFEMKNGAIEGGNLFVDGTGVFTMTGGTVAAMEINGNGATLTGSANVAALTVNAGKTADLTGLTGQVTVTATPGEVFATGEAALAQTKVLSAVKEQGFLLPVLAKDGKLYVDEASSVHCICGASLHGYQCQDNGELHYWQPWTDTTKLPSESGYWRLMNKVDMGAVVTLADQEIFLDLNGQTVNLQNGENLYTFAANKTAHVVVTDSSKEAKGLVKLTGSHTANGGITEVLSGNTLEVYRGTFDASEFTLANNGTVFSVKGGTCVMHSGKLVGGRAENGKNQKNGGTLWVVEGAQMTMKGGTVVGGYADKWGGAMYVNAAGTLFTMEGGTIEGGSAQKLGGNIMIRAGGTFRMTGGTVTGGSVVEGGEGANVYVYGDSTAANAGTFLMEGGTVTGGVYAPLESGNVKITGSAVIDASLTDDPYTAPAYGLKVDDRKTVDMTGLTGKVYVTAEPGKCFATGATAAMAETNVISQTKLDGTDLKVLFVEPNKLHMGAVYCVCGASLHGYPCQCDGKLQLWTDTDTLPTTSGYWRLTKSLDLTSAVKITTAETVYLDLNGNTVNVVNNNRLYNLTKNVATKVVITDSSKDSKGAVVVTGTSSGINGGILNLEAGNSFELYRATLDASGLKCTGGNGSALASRGNIVIHSGTVKGGTLDAGTKHGATIWLTDSSQTVMKDGLVVGGKAGRWAGTVYIAAANTYFKLEGGRIEGGTATELGGSFMVRQGQLHITGGTVTGGSAPDGANICIQLNGTLTMEGGTVTGGVYIVSGTNAAKKVTITKNAAIDPSLTDTTKFTAPAYGLKLGSGKTADVTGLTGTVYVSGAADAVIATGATAAMAETNVISEVADLKVVLTAANELQLVAK